MKNKAKRDSTISQSHVSSRVAYGPGTFFGKSDAYRAAQSGRYGEAVKLAEAHNSLCREISTASLEEWKRNAKINEIVARVQTLTAKEGSAP